MAYDGLETPFGKADRILGGAAVYGALAASQFNINCGIVSVIGNDFEESDLQVLRSRGIDLEGVEAVENGKTFFWKGKYHNDLNTRTTIETQLNVLETFNPVVPHNFQKADIVLLANLDPSVQLKTLEQIGSQPKLVILDTMNFWIENTPEVLFKVMGLTDVISINDEEARQLTEEYSLVKAAKKIHQMGPRYVIIKKGEHGALLFHEKNVFCIPALPLEDVFDPTGAGDSFAGGFAGYLTQTGNISFEQMKIAMIYGSALASFTVEKFGTENLIAVSKEELAQRIETFKNLTQFEIELI